MTVYRVRQKSTGLYSVGGLRFKFQEKGKTWPSIGAVKNHFALIERYAQVHRLGVVPSITVEAREYLASVEIVPFIVGEVERPSIPVADFLT